MAVTLTPRAATKAGFSWNSGASALEISLTPSTDGRVWVHQFLVGATASAASVNGSGATIIANNTDPNGITMVAYQADVSSGSAVTFAVTCSTQPVYPAILVYSTGTDVELDDSAYSAASSGVSRAVALAASDGGAALAMAYYGAGSGQVPTWGGITSLGALDLSGNSVAVGSEAGLTDDASYDVTATFTGSNTVVGLTALTLVEAAAAQEITGADFTNASSFGAGTVAPGAVSIAGAGLANASSFGAGTVAPGAVSITGAGFANASAFGSGTVEAAGANIEGSAFANAQAFGSGSVVPGPVTVSGAALVNESAFGAGAIQPGAVGVTGAAFSGVQAFGAGSLAVGVVEITGAAVSNASTFGAGTLTTGAVGITGAHFDNTQSFGAGTVAIPYHVALEAQECAHGTAMTPVDFSTSLGAGPYSLVDEYDALIDGLTLNPTTGVLSGTPTDRRGRGWHEIRVQDGVGNTAGMRMCSVPDINPANYTTAFDGTVINTEQTVSGGTGDLLLANLEINDRLTIHSWTGGIVTIYNPTVDTEAADNDGIRVATSGNVENLTIYGGTFNTGLNGIIVAEDTGVTHPGLRILNTRMIATGLSEGPTNKHGIYNQAPGALLEGNSFGPDADYPSAAGMHWGSGISTRSGSVVRGNRIRECKNDGIGYFADHPGAGTSLLIEQNDIDDINLSDTGRNAINLIALNAGSSPPAVAANLIDDATIRNNLLGEGNSVQVAADYASEGVTVTQSNNVEYLAGVITGEALVNTQSFGSGAVSVGPVAITGAALASTTSFGAGTVSTGAVNITGAALPSGIAFGSGAVEPGAVQITGASVENAQAFGAGAISVGPVEITGAAFSDVDTFGSGVIGAGAAVIEGAAFANGQSFGAGELASGPVEVTGAAFANASTFGAGVVGSGAIAIEGAATVNANAFGAGTLTAGPVDITGAAFGNVSVFGSGVVSTDAAVIVGTAFENATSFGSGAVTTGPVTIAGTGFENTTMFGTGAVSAGQWVISGAGFANASSFGSGVLSAGVATIGGQWFANPNAFGLGAVATGAVTIGGARFVNETVFGAGEVTNSAAAIVGTASTNAASFGSGAVTVGAVTITGAAFVNEPEFGVGVFNAAELAAPGRAGRYDYGSLTGATGGARYDYGSV